MCLLRNNVQVKAPHVEQSQTKVHNCEKQQNSVARLHNLELCIHFSQYKCCYDSMSTNQTIWEQHKMTQDALADMKLFVQFLNNKKRCQGQSYLFFLHFQNKRRVDGISLLAFFFFQSTTIHQTFITQCDTPKLISYRLTQIGTKILLDPSCTVRHAMNQQNCCHRFYGDYFFGGKWLFLWWKVVLPT